MVGENNKEINNKVKIKLIKAHTKNIIFYVPTKDGVKKLRIRDANQIKYSSNLVDYVEKNGIEYTKRIHSIYDGEIYLNWVNELELSKEDLLKLIETPKRKAPKYDKLMQLLKECEA